ncbi:MAG: hypothetical protein ACSLE6_17230 [Mycobacterium sp.]
MSTALDTMLSLNGMFTDQGFPASVEILARRKGGFSSKTVVVFLPLAIIVSIVSYLMRNPAKARMWADRLRGAFGSAPNPNNPNNFHPHNPHQGNVHSNYPYANNQPPGPGYNAAPSPAVPSWNIPPIASSPSAPTMFGPAPVLQHHNQHAGGPVAPAPVAGVQPGMRFNAPAGWPVPGVGWTPTADWRPDPSWPPAPAGWQFWVPLPQVNVHKPVQRFAAGTTYT